MKLLPKIFSLVIPIFVAIFIILTSVGLWMDPLLWNTIYNAPGFPPDSYGFTAKDRSKYAQISLEYMLNGSGISFLGDLKFPDGSSLFNERELSHMADVKRLAQSAIVTWAILAVLIVGSGLLAHRQKWMAVWGNAFSLGGWIAIGLIILVFIFTLTSFDTLFTDFHHLFFTGDSWLFLYSDTLIRLFPIAFWQDAFIIVGIVAAIFSVAAGILGRKLTSR